MNRLVQESRWTPSPEERLLARAGEAPVTSPASQPAAPVEQPLIDLTDDGPSAPANDAEAKTPEASPKGTPAVISTGPEWPGFRGAGRDVSCVAFELKPIGRRLRRSRCGADRSDPAGRRSRYKAIRQS
jgi:hypothetical protein